MKIGVFYASKYGTTKKAVEILKEKLEEESLDAEVHPVKKYHTDLSALEPFDFILVGGSIYMGKVQKTVKEFCEKNKEILLNNKLGLFLCCGSADDFEEQLSNNFSEDIIDHAVINGYFGYGYNLENMNFIYRKIVKKSANITSSENSIKEEAIIKYSAAIADLIE